MHEFDTPPAWPELKKRLQALDKTALIAMVKALHEATSENRALIASRLAPAAEDAAERLERFRPRIREPFFPASGGTGGLNFSDARKAIREYRKASADIAGTIDLMLTFVESGVEFALLYGEVDDAFTEGIEDMVVATVKLLRTPEGVEQVGRATGRLRRAGASACEGELAIGEFLMEVVEEIEAYFDGY